MIIFMKTSRQICHAARETGFALGLEGRRIAALPISKGRLQGKNWGETTDRAPRACSAEARLARAPRRGNRGVWYGKNGMSHERI